MKPFTKGRKISAVILLISGIAIIGYGFYIVKEGDTSFENAEKESSIPTIRHAGWEYNVGMKLINNKTAHINTVFFFQTNEVFAVDNSINYTITSTVLDSTQIKHIFWFFDNNQHDFANQYGKNFDNALQVGQVEDSVVNLTQRDSNHYIFVKTGVWNDTVPEQVTMYGFGTTEDKIENKTAYIIGSSQTLFNVDSPVAILQAQTDRDLIKQSHESDKTNAHVEGLTIILIGLIPIGIVGEIAVERWWVG